VRVRHLPLVLAHRLSADTSKMDADLARWEAIQGVEPWAPLGQPEFRSLFYHRLAEQGRGVRLLLRLLRVIYRPEATLYLNTPEIGPGLFIQHGFATVVAAERVGANCWINQQVTVGFVVTDREHISAPVIEDGAVVYAGAKVLGGVRVGRNATVGAGAVVVKDVPDGMTAIGVPAVNRPTGRHARMRD
jgi:serine O-acetyltransferase